MPEKGIPSLKMAFQMATKCQHAGIIRHLTNRKKARNNRIQKNTASNYKCQAGLNAAKQYISRTIKVGNVKLDIAWERERLN